VELLAATTWRGCPWVLTDGGRWQHRGTSAWRRRVDGGARVDSKTVKVGRSRAAEDAMLPARCSNFFFFLCFPPSLLLSFLSIHSLLSDTGSGGLGW
jgi:hypothetical protein